MSILVINEEIIKEIKKLVEYAEANILTIDDLLDIQNGDKEIVGNLEQHMIHIPMGYKIVYSVEMQPAGKCRHLSMSVNSKSGLPIPEAAKEIMQIIGYKNPLDKCTIWMEDIGNNKKAINILEKID